MMDDRAAREKLAAALLAATTDYGTGKAAPEVDLFDFYAATLLPVVREIAAEELREAADDLDTRAVELWNAYKSGPISDPRRASPHTEGESDGWENAGTHVRARADVLEG